MRMTSGGTDEIEIEIEIEIAIEIFRHSPRRDGTARGLCHFQLRTRVWIEMFASRGESLQGDVYFVFR